MAAKENVTISTQFTTSAREVDFVTRFNDNWDALRTILGIMRPIRKAPGTKLVSYKAEVDGALQGGATVAEGDEIPFTKMKVSPVTYGDIEVAKYAKSVTIESVAKYGPMSFQVKPGWFLNIAEKATDVIRGDEVINSTPAT